MTYYRLIEYKTVEGELRWMMEQRAPLDFWSTAAGPFSSKDEALEALQKYRESDTYGVRVLND